MKSQAVVDKQSEKVMATYFGPGRSHDFSLFKKSQVALMPSTKLVVDSGYQGVKKIHPNSDLPKKRTKNHPLTKEDKKANRKIAQERALNENVLARLKKFHIISDKYRNRRKRFGLRFNLIAGIYNFELELS
jgi:hypothetical protein